MTARAFSFTLASIRQWFHGFVIAHPLSTWRDQHGRVCRLACGKCGRIFWEGDAR